MILNAEGLLCRFPVTKCVSVGQPHSVGVVQGIYSMRPDSGTDGGVHLSVSTFCVHGGPNGKISGITGAVSCAQPFALSLLPEFETPLEREEQIAEKCSLRFPAIPFIPPEPYDVIRTDYDSYALVQVRCYSFCSENTGYYLAVS
jgi:hypothetical protein